MPRVSVVVLTMGDRPAELAAAIASARDQADVEVEVVLVVNGGRPDRSLADVVVDPGENLGVPGGRNAGAAAATGELLCFLDDDGELLDDAVLVGAGDRFEADPGLAVVGLRIVDDDGLTARRHQPRLGASGAGEVTSFPGGACVIRGSAFAAVGGLCEAFFYGLEETDLAWRLIDAGWSVAYADDLRMRHPHTDPRRHTDFFETTARNRVWLAHRALPWPLALLYVLDWTVLTAARNAVHPSAIAAHLRGTVAGWRTRPGPRRPMRWRTVVRLSRLGRPPVI